MMKPLVFPLNVGFHAQKLCIFGQRSDAPEACPVNAEYELGIDAQQAARPQSPAPPKEGKHRREAPEAAGRPLCPPVFLSARPARRLTALYMLCIFKYVYEKSAVSANAKTARINYLAAPAG